jgi:hypothetical protein
MQVLDEVNGESVRQFADKFIQLHAMVNTDMLNIYNVLCEPYYDYLSQIFNPVTNPDHLDWIHTFISNAKAFLSGACHGLDKKYLQRCLSEFGWRANRRKFEGQWFRPLLYTCSLNPPATHNQLVRSEVLGHYN